MERHPRHHRCDKANHKRRRGVVRGGKAAHRDDRREMVDPDNRMPQPRQ